MREIEQKLRTALAAERLADVPTIMEEYRRRFDQMWAALSPLERAESDLPGNAQALLHWAIPVAASMRSAAAERRRVLRTAGPYRAMVRGRRSTWQCEG